MWQVVIFRGSWAFIHVHLRERSRIMLVGLGVNYNCYNDICPGNICLGENFIYVKGTFVC